MQSYCVNCEKSYEVTDSEARTAQLYCSPECEKQDEDWIAEGNARIENAKELNPSMFAKTELTAQQNEAIEIIRKSGVKFSTKEIENE